MPDCVFIDRAKRPYKEDVSAIIERCSGKQILILADNVEDRKQELADFLEWFGTIALTSTIVPTQCGLLVAWV